MYFTEAFIALPTNSLFTFRPPHPNCYNRYPIPMQRFIVRNILSYRAQSSYKVLCLMVAIPLEAIPLKIPRNKGLFILEISRQIFVERFPDRFVYRAKGHGNEKGLSRGEQPHVQNLVVNPS